MGLLKLFVLLPLGGTLYSFGPLIGIQLQPICIPPGVHYVEHGPWACSEHDCIQDRSIPVPMHHLDIYISRGFYCVHAGSWPFGSCSPDSLSKFLSLELADQGLMDLCLFLGMPVWCAEGASSSL